MMSVKNEFLELSLIILEWIKLSIKLSQGTKPNS